MPFDDKYFSTEAYADVSFAKYSQYWWSNRFYTLLARKHGPKEGHLLEIGCGLGHLLAFLVPYYEVTGGDINAYALEKAQQNAPQARIEQFSAEDLSIFQDDFFQIVIAKHIVEHLPNPQKGISEMARVLAPCGLLIISTPNLDSPMHAFQKKDWIGYMDPTHISLKPPSEWFSLIKKEGLHINKYFTDGFWAVPYLPFVPTFIQKFIFGLPGGLQAILGWSFLPLTLGETLIILAKKHNER
jgi:SAM-dependent methyltransferase